MAEKTDTPAGVVNIVASSDHALGEILSGDPRVDLVSFTGSTATGRRVMERASSTVKKVFLELGGKSANIVLDDANFAAVLPMSSFTCVHGGQGCAITTRLLLPRSRYAEGLEIVKAAFERWKYGDPTNPAHMQGPQISKRQQERVLALHREGPPGGRAPASSAAACPRSSRRATTSSRRCSPTSIPSRASRRRRSSARCCA